MNLIASLVFALSGALVVLLLIVRIKRLSVKERNAVAAAFAGFALCSRYANLIGTSARPTPVFFDWCFVFACAGVMGILALSNLGFGQPRSASR